MFLLFPKQFLRAMRLRCPRCGNGKLYRGFITMNKRCGDCDLQFERESGFFLGAIYFNYGLTALIVTVLYMAMFLSMRVSPFYLRAIPLAIAVVFPLLFFRHARSLWLGFDFVIDPRNTNEQSGSEWHEEAGNPDSGVQDDTSDR